MIATPNPMPLPNLLEAEAVSHHRSLFCPEYDDCLELAAGGRWVSFSCEHCALAGPGARLIVLYRAACATSETADDPQPVAVNG